MLLGAILLLTSGLSHAQPQKGPDFGPMKAMGQCVLAKVQKWAASTEEAKVIVEAALQGCEAYLRDVRRSVLIYVDESSPDLPAEQKLKAADEMVAQVQQSLRTVGYEAVIKARTPG